MASREINFEEVKKVVDGAHKGIIIDVRYPEEIETQGGIPNALNIPAKEILVAFCMGPSKFKKRYGVDKPDYTANIIFTARSGNKAEKAHQVALDLGYENASLYGGGFNDWFVRSAKLAGRKND